MTTNKTAELEAYGVIRYKINNTSQELDYVVNPYGESTTRVSATWNAGTPNTILHMTTTYKVKGYSVYTDRFNPR